MKKNCEDMIRGTVFIGASRLVRLLIATHEDKALVNIASAAEQRIGNQHYQIAETLFDELKERIVDLELRKFAAFLKSCMAEAAKYKLEQPMPE